MTNTEHKDLFSTLEPLLPVLAEFFNKSLVSFTDTRDARCKAARRGFRLSLKTALIANGFCRYADAITGDPDSVRWLELDAPLAASSLWWLMVAACSSVHPSQIISRLESRPMGDTSTWDSETTISCKNWLGTVLANSRKITGYKNKNDKFSKDKSSGPSVTKALKKQRHAQAARQAAESRKVAEVERLERERLGKILDQENLLSILNSICSKHPCSMTAIAFRELQAQHKVHFNETLTLPKCMKRHGLSQETRQRIEVETADLVEQARIERASKSRLAAITKVEREAARAWENSLLHTCDVQKLLGITTTERDRWIKDKTLRVAQYREFTKWRKTFNTPYFDPTHIAEFTQPFIQDLREKHAKVVFASRSAAAQNASVKTAKTREIKKVLKINNYEEQFLQARDLGREWHLCLGPTNSGKTHAAMQALAEAESGIYLAPLRLLALENYERLKAKGIPVNLMTGEERIFDPRAKHTCATVEMCNFTDVVDVAVIDEIQLLTDPQRGWAWTAALLGVPAKTVYACGAPHAQNALQQLAGICYETCTVREFERLVPLEVSRSSVSLSQVQAGDAVIAFSRREVLQFATAIKARGLGVSVIYGALSPEVRRSQVQAFTEGRTQVVVATDAIGLGINLAIKRVVFSAMTKYDGISNRDLTANEIRQIAGRAGRYGLSENGVVTGFSQDYLPQITHALNQSMDSFTAPYAVIPTWSHVETVMKKMGITDVGQAFEFFARIKFGGQFVQTDLMDCIARHEALESVNAKISAIDQFMLCCAPADPKNQDDMALLRGAAYSLTPDYVLPIPKALFDLNAKEPTGYELQQAESYSRALALYSWIACKWPGAVLDTGLAELRSITAEFVDRALLVHKEEFVSKRNIRYGWRNENFDDGC